MKRHTTYAVEEAPPGLFIFEPDRYAIMWTLTAEPRIPFSVLSQPTNVELMAGFRFVVFNGSANDVRR